MNATIHGAVVRCEPHFVVEQRRWRHLPTMQFETIIVAPVPRLKYPDNSKGSDGSVWTKRVSA